MVRKSYVTGESKKGAGSARPLPPPCYSPELIMNNVFLGVLLQKFQMYRQGLRV